MRICFVFWSFEDCPVGGYKVVYEYVNRFAARGHQVTLVYPYMRMSSHFLLGPLIHPMSYIRQYKFFRAWREKILRERVTWFKIDNRVNLKPVFYLAPWMGLVLGIRNLYVATYVKTAARVNAFWGPRKNKFYFIQDFEDWDVSGDEVNDSYRLKLKKIAIASWLVDCVRKAGVDAHYVPNGLDFNYFKLSRPVESRESGNIAFLWHTRPAKRTDIAIAALEKVRLSHPEIKVQAFGTDDRPASLPAWIQYIRQPDRTAHNALYNDAAIFVAASEREGWGLTPCEAMQCGAAVACTDCGGFKTFAKDGVTALTSPVNDIDGLARNVVRLIEDDVLRIKIAQAGYENIKRFQWEDSVEAFLNILEGGGV